MTSFQSVELLHSQHFDDITGNGCWNWFYVLLLYALESAALTDNHDISIFKTSEWLPGWEKYCTTWASVKTLDKARKESGIKLITQIWDFTCSWNSLFSYLWQRIPIYHRIRSETCEIKKETSLKWFLMHKSPAIPIVRLKKTKEYLPLFPMNEVPRSTPLSLL